jgi:hypothetical protein
MNAKRKALAALSSLLIGVGTACAGGSSTDTTNTTAAAETEVVDDVAAPAELTAADATTTDATTTEATTTEATTTDASSTDATTTEDAAATSSGGPQSGPGGGVEASSVASVDDLVALIQEAYGDPSLGLQRGHQPVESILIEVLGISHDEMHVRMEAGQNLAAVATDLGIDPQTLIDALVASQSSAIDNLAASGTISEDEAADYLDALEEAFTFRVTWNGSDDTPTFSGI